MTLSQLATSKKIDFLGGWLKAHALVSLWTTCLVGCKDGASVWTHLCNCLVEWMNHSTYVFYVICLVLRLKTTDVWSKWGREDWQKCLCYLLGYPQTLAKHISYFSGRGSGESKGETEADGSPTLVTTYIFVISSTTYKLFW